MYILYGGRFTRVLITEAVLLEAQLSYELREVDILNDDHKTEEFLSINPSGFVPVLITPDGHNLYETPAINLYLAECHPEADLAPTIGHPMRGEFLSALFYVTGELEPAMKRYFYPHRYVANPDDVAVIKAKAMDAARDRLQSIEKRLTEAGPYTIGEQFSLVDITLSFWTMYLEEMGGLDQFPAVKRCQDLMRARPRIQEKFEFQKMQSREYAEMQARDEGVQ